MTKIAQRIEVWPVGRLKPYERNARTHSPEQVTQIAASLAEFGFTNPILVDSADGIIAGHGRLEAAKELGLAEVPVIVLDHLSDAQRRAYILADNKLAELSGWDVDLLAGELLAIAEADEDLAGKLGFSAQELEAFTGEDVLGDEAGDGGDGDGVEYSRKIEAPAYTPKMELAPEPAELADLTRFEYLRGRIEAAAMPDEVRRFLLLAAGRHIVFDYKKIAEYYCHAPADIQRFMEESALVIIDFDRAIDGGYIELSQRLMNIYASSYNEADGENDDDDE